MTLEEVFDFIDNTPIKTIDVLELKSRIAELVKTERAKAVDEVSDKFDKWIKSDKKLTYFWTEFQVEFMKIAEQMKGGAK